jgi:hypothetical protein
LEIVASIIMLGGLSSTTSSLSSSSSLLLVPSLLPLPWLLSGNSGWSVSSITVSADVDVAVVVVVVVDFVDANASVLEDGSLFTLAATSSSFS